MYNRNYEQQNEYIVSDYWESTEMYVESNVREKIACEILPGLKLP